MNVASEGSERRNLKAVPDTVDNSRLIQVEIKKIVGLLALMELAIAVYSVHKQGAQNTEGLRPPNC